MTKFNYTITDEFGIHARPAGLLVKEAEKFESNISIKLSDNTADAKRIFSIMSLGVKQGDMIEVSIDGPDENEAKNAIEKFLGSNL